MNNACKLGLKLKLEPELCAVDRLVASRLDECEDICLLPAEDISEDIFHRSRASPTVPAESEPHLQDVILKWYNHKEILYVDFIKCELDLDPDTLRPLGGAQIPRRTCI